MWDYYSLLTDCQEKGYNDNTLNDKEMVQRQYAAHGDTRGSVRMGHGEENASAVPLKSDIVDLSHAEIVVNAIDARQIVDEIRDSSPPDDNRREESSLESLALLSKATKDQMSVPRASWFDVFDWNGVKGPDEDKPTVINPTVVVTGEEVYENSVDIKVVPSNTIDGIFVHEKHESPLISPTGNDRKYPIIPTTNSIVTQTDVQSLNVASAFKAEAETVAPVDPPEQKKVVAPSTQREEDLSLCAMVMEETIVDNETELRAHPASNADVSDGTCSICLCFRDDEVGETEQSPKTSDSEKPRADQGPINRDFLYGLFSCIDPTPTINNGGDLLEEIEKTLTAEMIKEEKFETAATASDSVLYLEHEQPNTAVSEAPARSIVVNGLTPALSNMICNQEMEDKSQDENLLDKDLASLPSVKDDFGEAVPPIQTKDLGSPKTNTNSASLVEKKAMELKVPTIFRDEQSLISNGTGLSSKITIDPSIDARRSLLIKELRSAISTFGRYDIRCANISAALGDLMEEAKDYEHAIKLHKDAGTIYSCKLGDDHATTLNAKMRLGSVLENAGRVEEAINNYYQVTVMQRALHGDQDPSVAEGLVRMAQALRKKGDFQPAIKELKRALKIFRDTLGDSHEKVSSTVDEIASLYVIIGDFDKSAAILEEVVKLKAATTGMKSKAVASTLGNLATAYECSEKFDEAMKALKKSYKIYTETAGYSSEDATTTLNRMAQLYEALNDPNRAAVAYLGVLRGRKIQLGPDHLSVGETYFRLGHSLRETKQYDKALKCLKEALPIFVGQGVEMNDVKMVAEIMHEMAMINEDRGHYQDASRIFKQELSVLRKIGQPEFPFAARTLKHLGITEYFLKNYSRSLKYFVEALSIYQNHNDQGLECADVLVHTGLVFFKVDNKDRAKEVFQEAVRIYGNHKTRENYTLFQEAKDYLRLIEQGK